MRQPERGSPIWWAWAALILVLSWFVGLGIGKVVRRYVLTLALTEAMSQIVHMLIVLPFCVAWGLIVHVLDGKLFRDKWNLYIYRPPDKKAA